MYQNISGKYTNPRRSLEYNVCWSSREDFACTNIRGASSYYTFLSPKMSQRRWNQVFVGKETIVIEKRAGQEYCLVQLWPFYLNAIKSYSYWKLEVSFCRHPKGLITQPKVNVTLVSKVVTLAEVKKIKKHVHFRSCPKTVGCVKYSGHLFGKYQSTKVSGSDSQKCFLLITLDRVKKHVKSGKNWLHAKKRRQGLLFCPAFLDMLHMPT